MWLCLVILMIFPRFTGTAARSIRDRFVAGWNDED
jgi:hypothetical protein